MAWETIPRGRARPKTYTIELTEKQLHYIQWATYEYDLQDDKSRCLDPHSKTYEQISNKIKKQIGLKARGSLTSLEAGQST
jgi:hypothetical protein